MAAKRRWKMVGKVENRVDERLTLIKEAKAK
jgi:hypothetical protein